MDESVPVDVAGPDRAGLRGHAGPVVAPDLVDGLAQRLGQHRGRVGGEKPSLRVPADVEPAPLVARPQRLGLQVERGGLLGGRHGEAQHEVLFPADKGVVGAPEGDVGAPVAELAAHRGELQGPLIVHEVDVGAQPRLAEARRRPERADKALVDGRERAHPRGDVAVGPVEKRVARLADADRAPVGGRRHDSAEVEVGDAGEDEVVRVVEGPLVEAEVASPLEVVAYVCQAPAPPKTESSPPAAAGRPPARLGGTSGQHTPMRRADAAGAGPGQAGARRPRARDAPASIPGGACFGRRASRWCPEHHLERSNGSFRATWSASTSK